MGVYIFSKKAMDDLLNVIECVEEQLDFGKHIIPMAMRGAQRAGARHQGYWQPIRTQRDWYDANMGLCDLARVRIPTRLVHDRPQLSDLDPPRCLPPRAFAAT